MKMDRVALQDSDDSSTGSEHSVNASGTNRAMSFVKLSSIPSMYSKNSNDGDADSASEELSAKDATSEGTNYDDLPVSDEIKELFQLVDAYEPIAFDIETPLKCFLPSKMFVAVGRPDPFVHIPRPDGVPDGLGAAVLDEPIPANQSNAAAIELRLRNHSKRAASRSVPVRSIENAPDHRGEIDQWITSVEEVNVTRPSPEVRHRHKMPTMEEVMQTRPKEIREAMRTGQIELPSPDIDLSVEEYARTICSLLGIPVHDGCLLESMHATLSLFAKLQGSNVPCA